MRKFRIGCGVVVAVFLVLTIGQIFLVYSARGGLEPCYGPLPPPYPNRLTSQEYTFVATDSTAQILEFYQRTGPLPPPEYTPRLQSQFINEFSYHFPPLIPLMNERPRHMCGILLIVRIHEYGFFRIGMLTYLYGYPPGVTPPLR